jgi:uncharacterized protein YdcH (DUF465 family)
MSNIKNLKKQLASFKRLAAKVTKIETLVTNSVNKLYDELDALKEASVALEEEMQAAIDEAGTEEVPPPRQPTTQQEKRTGRGGERTPASQRGEPTETSSRRSATAPTTKRERS